MTVNLNNIYRIDLDTAREMVAALTPRQRQAVERIAYGDPMKRIAADLNIGLNSFWEEYSYKLSKKWNMPIYGFARVWFAAHDPQPVTVERSGLFLNRAKPRVKSRLSKYIKPELAARLQKEMDGRPDKTPKSRLTNPET